MNERILKFALDSHLLNYVDNETPRFYFVSGAADIEDVETFGKLMVEEFERYIQDANGDIDYVRFLIDKNLK